MKKAGIEAVALHKNTSQKDVLEALCLDGGVHLIFASPKYLLHNPRMKKFYADKEDQTHILGVLVNKAHIIHEWAANFQKDYYELKTLQVILGNDILWRALSATFTDPVFKTVYEMLSFGTSCPFWGINAGTEWPNLAQYIWPMASATNSYLSLIPSHSSLRVPKPNTTSRRPSYFSAQFPKHEMRVLLSEPSFPPTSTPLSSHLQHQMKRPRRRCD